MIYFIKNLSVSKEFYRFLHIQPEYQNLFPKTLAECQRITAVSCKYRNLMKTKNSLSQYFLYHSY